MKISRKQQAENRRIWIEALRSDRFKQGRGKLRVGDKFCCLGIACEVLGIPATKVTTASKTFRYDGSIHMLSPDVQTMLGLKDGDGGYGDFENIQSGSLTFLNDTERWSLTEIADFIEKNEKYLIIEETDGHR